MTSRRHFLFTAVAGMAAAFMVRFFPKYRIRALLRQVDIQEAWDAVSVHPNDAHSAAAPGVAASLISRRWERGFLISQEQIRHETRSIAKTWVFTVFYSGTNVLHTANLRFDRCIIEADLAKAEARVLAQLAKRS